jgi:hypothetical protein
MGLGSIEGLHCDLFIHLEGEFCTQALAFVAFYTNPTVQGGISPRPSKITSPIYPLHRQSLHSLLFVNPVLYNHLH